MFLDSVKDCNYINLDDANLTEVLNGIAQLSIEDFLFPKIKLTYTYDGDDDTDDIATEAIIGVPPALDVPATYSPLGYCFDKEIGIAELKVIIAFMKKYWVSYQITYSKNFENPFFDKEIKMYSPANLLKVMSDTLVIFTRAAEQARFDYGRVDKDGKPVWGSING